MFPNYLKARYRVALDVYHGIARKNLEQASAGNCPSAEELLREDEAALALALARLEYRGALGEAVANIDDLSSLKARYNIAAAVFKEIAERNAAQAASGARPRDEDLKREEEARDKVAAARREYLDALTGPTEDT
jgi:hypothetical protein